MLKELKVLETEVSGGSYEAKRHAERLEDMEERKQLQLEIDAKKQWLRRNPNSERFAQVAQEHNDLIEARNQQGAIKAFNNSIDQEANKRLRQDKLRQQGLREYAQAVGNPATQRGFIYANLSDPKDWEVAESFYGATRSDYGKDNWGNKTKTRSYGNNTETINSTKAYKEMKQMGGDLRERLNDIQNVRAPSSNAIETLEKKDNR